MTRNHKQKKLENVQLKEQRRADLEMMEELRLEAERLRQKLAEARIGSTYDHMRVDGAQNLQAMGEREDGDEVRAHGDESTAKSASEDEMAGKGQEVGSTLVVE